MLIMVSMSDLFRERRIRLGLTQEQAAAAAGLSRRTVIDFETGGERISIGNLARLLGAIGLELTARERSPRPTLDELPDQYRGEESRITRQRARPGKRAR